MELKEGRKPWGTFKDGEGACAGVRDRMCGQKTRRDPRGVARVGKGAFQEGGVATSVDFSRDRGEEIEEMKGPR